MRSLILVRTVRKSMVELRCTRNMLYRLTTAVRRVRSWILSALARPGLHGGSQSRINGFTKFNKNTHIGANFNTNGLTVFGYGTVFIGDNFHSGSNVKFYTSSHNYNGSGIPYDRMLINYDIVVEDQVWLGSDVTVVGNVRIGEGAIVQVGSVVSSNVPKGAIVGGNPAKVFKSRDMDAYETNKAAGRFH